MRTARRVQLLAIAAGLAACGRAAFEDAAFPGTIGHPSLSPTPPTRFRRSVTVPRALVGTASTVTLADFPVLVSLTDASLAAHVAQDDASDVLFEGTDATTCAGSAPPCELRREIVRFDRANGSIAAYVRIPSLHGPASPDDTTFVIRYGGSVAANDPETWEPHYKAVWHLVSSSAGVSADSTGGPHDVALIGTTWTTAGVLAPAALDFNGTSSAAYAGSAADMAMSTGYTLEGWMRTRTLSGAHRMVFRGGVPSGAFSEYGIGQVNSNVRFEMNTGGTLRVVDSVSPLVPGTWTRATGTWDGTTMRIYLGTAMQASAAVTGTITPQNPRLSIGFSNLTPANFWSGSLQGVRISDLPRAREWIATSARDERSPSAFTVLGPEIAE